MRSRGDRPVTARITWRVLGMFAYNDVRTGPGCSPKVWLNLEALAKQEKTPEELAHKAWVDAMVFGEGVVPVGPPPHP